MSKRHVHKPQKGTISGKISDKATENADQGGSTDHLSPSFRFTHADENRWLLSDWESHEIDDLIRALKKIERHTWAQLKTQGSKQRGGSVGCGYKIIEKYPSLPDSVSEDVTFSEMRVCQKKRIFGFRIGSLYYIVWFDRGHDVFPE